MTICGSEKLSVFKSQVRRSAKTQVHILRGTASQAACYLQGLKACSQKGVEKKSVALRPMGLVCEVETREWLSQTKLM